MPTATRWTRPAASPVAGPLHPGGTRSPRRRAHPGARVAYDLVLVGGVPGAGKTTAIARATDDLAHVRAIDPEHVTWWLRQRLPDGGCPTGRTAGWCTCCTPSGC